MYGRTQFISSLITKARDKVRGFYRLMGTADQVKEDVKWLLTQSRFMYQDIDVAVRIGILFAHLLTSHPRNVPMTKPNHLALN
jgi:hypothetical protein